MELRKIIMLTDKLGSIDGINPKEFKKGNVYEVGKDITEYLAKGWVQTKACEIYPKVALETKKR